MIDWITVTGSDRRTVYPKKYAQGFVVLCFVVVTQSFIMNSHEVFIHIHQGCFAGTGAIVRLPQCQWSKPDGHGKISQCITTTKHSKAKNRVHISWDRLYQHENVILECIFRKNKNRPRGCYRFTANLLIYSHDDYCLPEVSLYLGPGWISILSLSVSVLLSICVSVCVCVSTSSLSNQ